MNEQQAREEFRNLSPYLEEWGRFIDSYLLALLEEHIVRDRIVKYPKFRIKKEDSFIRKAFWRESRMDNPMKMRDKVGTRIVLISYDDLVDVVRLIEKEELFFSFKIKKEPNFGEPNEYQAYHIIISPTINSPVLSTETKLFSKLSCELQIKTAVQDTLSSVSHETIYKGYHSYNEEIKNKFKKIVAKFTVLELELLEIEKEMRTESAHITSFVSGLKSIGSEVFSRSYQSDKEDYDLTVAIYQKYHPKEGKIELDDLKKALDSNKDPISHLFSVSQSYLLKQPISLFVIYLVLSGRSKTLLKEWQYDEDVLKDICRYLGYSDESLSH